MKSAGISNTAPAVPSKVRPSTFVAAGLFRCLVTIRRWWVWIVAVSSASENVMTVSRSGAVRDKVAPLIGACEHAFGLTSKGSIVGQLQRAIAKRDVLAVRSLAGELPSVPLPLAAEITVLLLEREPESYAPAARRLLARLASERAMPLRQLVDIAAILAELEGNPAIAGADKLVALIQDAPPP
jgi:hypothetical protein